MIQAAGWQRIGAEHYILDRDQRTLHAFWTRDASSSTQYFLALSDNTSGLPYEKRPLEFAQLDVRDRDPGKGLPSVDCVPDKSVAKDILQYRDMIDIIPGIPEERKPHFLSLLNALEQL